MLFKRREKQPLAQKVRNLLWPKMSFSRIVDYYKYRTVRIPASEHSIAAGVAFGCLVSWTPTFGTHLLQCALFNWITKTNFPAAFIGSAFGNPWTTPLLMYLAYQAGKMIFILFGHGDFILPFDGHITAEILLDNKLKILLPTLIGGYTIGILTFPLYYYPTYYVVKGARAARRARIEQKLHKTALEMTEPSE